MTSDPATLAARFAVALTSGGVPYATGGAIAYGYWGVPRGTRDLDIYLFVVPEQAGSALDRLIDAGLDIDREAAIRSGVERGDARGTCDGVPVDLFFVSIPLHEAAAGRAVEVELLGSKIRVLSAEDLAVFKLLFFRGKDVVDVERLVAVQGARLDRNHVRRWLVECVGAKDARASTWDRICGELR